LSELTEWERVEPSERESDAAGGRPTKPEKPGKATGFAWKELREEIIERAKVMLDEAPTGKESEQVIMKLELLLKMQDAVDYEVVKIFTRDLNHQQLVELIFRLGVTEALKVIKPIAIMEGLLL